MTEQEMRDRVIKGLEICHVPNDCDKCLYNGGCDCIRRLMADALALLKNSRLTPRKPWHTKVAYASGNEWITDQCPECVKRGAGIWDTLLDRHAPFCRRCGQALDWSEYDGREQIDWDEYMSHVSERAVKWG